MKNLSAGPIYLQFNGNVFFLLLFLLFIAITVSIIIHLIYQVNLLQPEIDFKIIITFLYFSVIITFCMNTNAIRFSLARLKNVDCIQMNGCFFDRTLQLPWIIYAPVNCPPGPLPKSQGVFYTLSHPSVGQKLKSADSTLGCHSLDQKVPSKSLRAAPFTVTLSSSAPAAKTRSRPNTPLCASIEYSKKCGRETFENSVFCISYLKFDYMNNNQKIIIFSSKLSIECFSLCKGSNFWLVLLAF